VRLNLCSIGLVTSSDMDPSLLQKITVVLTAAQIEAMNGAPVNIIPAPLAGQVVVPDQFVIQAKPGGTNFTGGGAVTFQYHGTSVNPHAGNLAAATARPRRCCGHCGRQNRQKCGRFIPALTRS
jgi:hypothetical protein